MKTMIVSMMVFISVVLAAGCAGPYPANAAYTGRRCVSNVQCQKTEVCWTYEVSPVIRDGYCGKLASE